MSKSMFVLVAVLALALAAHAGPNANKASKDKVRVTKDPAVSGRSKGTKDPSITKGTKGTKDPSVTKGTKGTKAPSPFKACKALSGAYDRKTKTCDTTNAAALQACAATNPPGKWNKKTSVCTERKVSANGKGGKAKTCNKAFGRWVKTTKNCDMTNATAKQACLETTAKGKWNSKENTCKQKKSKKTTTVAPE